MKKLTTYILLCLATFSVHSAFGQDTSRVKQIVTDDGDDEDAPQGQVQKHHAHAKIQEAPVVVGIVGGFNDASLIVRGNESGTVNGILLGGIVDIHLGGVAHLEAGLRYAMTGGSGVILTDGETVTWSVNTIEVPVIFQFKFGQPGRNHFYVGAGGYGAYNVSGSSTSDLNGGVLTIGSGTDASLKAFDAGILLYIGYQLKDGLFFRIMGQGGLSNLQPQPESATVRTSSSSLEIGYLFGKAGKTKKHAARSKEDTDVEMKM